MVPEILWAPAATGWDPNWRALALPKPLPKKNSAEAGVNVETSKGLGKNWEIGEYT